MLYAKFWKVASPIPISDETRPKICPKPSPGKITRTKSAKTSHKRGRKISSLKKTKLPVCQPNQLQGLHQILFAFSKLSGRLSVYEIGFRILSRVLEVLFAKICNMRKMAAMESFSSYFWTQILKQIFKNEFYSGIIWRFTWFLFLSMPKVLFVFHWPYMSECCGEYAWRWLSGD